MRTQSVEPTADYQQRPRWSWWRCERYQNSQIATLSRPMNRAVSKQGGKSKESIHTNVRIYDESSTKYCGGRLCGWLGLLCSDSNANSAAYSIQFATVAIAAWPWQLRFRLSASPTAYAYAMYVCIFVWIRIRIPFSFLWTSLHNIFFNIFVTCLLLFYYYRHLHRSPRHTNVHSCLCM